MRKKSIGRAAFSTMTVLGLSVLSLLTWGCSSVSSKEPLLIDGYFKAHDIGGARDCVALAHSKRFKKIVYSCLPTSVRIVSTDTGEIKSLKLNMDDTQPFIHQTEDEMLLYFPSNPQNAAIREIDVLAGTYFDRPIIVEPGLTYREVYLNPRDRCMAVSIDENAGKFPERVVVKVYDYEPKDRAPIRVGGKGKIEVTKGENLASLGGANNNRLACVRDGSGQLVLYITRLEQDFEPSKPGGMMWRYTEHTEELLFHGDTFFRFFQPKLKPYIFARDGINSGLMQINTDTGEINTIGKDVGGLWEDYDPSTRTGVLVMLEPADASFYSKHGGGARLVRICVADIDYGTCIEGQPSGYSMQRMFTPSASNGWLGDGFISESDQDIFISRTKLTNLPEKSGSSVISYWY